MGLGVRRNAKCFFIVKCLKIKCMTKNVFYEKNDKVFTTYPVVKNTVSKELIDSIPESVAGRRDFLKKHLNNLDGKTIYCPSLGVNVSIILKSIVETSENAAITKESTIAALNVVELIKNSIYDGMDIPVSRTQTSKFHFIFVYRLKAMLEDYGVAKTLIGVRLNPSMMFLQYSVTLPQLE